MKTLLLLATACLAACSRALSAPAARDTSPTEHLINGGFESCPKREEFQPNIHVCDWKFSGRAMYFIGVNETPYGEAFADFYRQKPNNSRGTLSQLVSGLLTGEMYQLSYAYAPGNRYGDCTVTTMLSDQTLDTLSIPANNSVYNSYWRPPYNISFAAGAASGKFSLELYCAPKGGYWGFSFDALSLTGPHTS